MKRLIITTILIVCFVAASGRADPFSWMIGDNDGYGLAIPIPDNGQAPDWHLGIMGPPPHDWRSAAEAAATNGAQLTDVYSSVYGPTWSVNPGETGQVVFTLPNNLISATLEIDMGDFQANEFGQVAVFYNGVAQPGQWNFQDGYRATVVRQFVLDATAIANANAAGQFDIGINHVGSTDYIAFDYFSLQGQIVPIPGAVLLGILGLSVAGLKLRKFS